MSANVPEPVAGVVVPVVTSASPTGELKSQKAMVVWLMASEENMYEKIPNSNSFFMVIGFSAKLEARLYADVTANDAMMNK